MLDGPDRFVLQRVCLALHSHTLPNAIMETHEVLSGARLWEHFSHVEEEGSLSDQAKEFHDLKSPKFDQSRAVQIEIAPFVVKALSVVLNPFCKFELC